MLRSAVIWLAAVSLIIAASGADARSASASSAVAVRYTIVPERSEARYRIREQLAGLSFPNDAVGTTRGLEGGIGLDTQGRVVGTSRFTVDLRTLTSDQPRRDNYVRRNTLETERYPTATFVPVEVRGLGVPVPRRGSATFELVGDFTVRTVTRRTTWQAAATFNGAEVDVRARTAMRFADLGLQIPRVASVLSVEDEIRLELDLVLRRSS